MVAVVAPPVHEGGKGMTPAVGGGVDAVALHGEGGGGGDGAASGGVVEDVRGVAGERAQAFEDGLRLCRNGAKVFAPHLHRFLALADGVAFDFPAIPALPVRRGVVPDRGAGG